MRDDDDDAHGSVDSHGSSSVCVECLLAVLWLFSYVGVHCMFVKLCAFRNAGFYPNFL